MTTLRVYIKNVADELFGPVSSTTTVVLKPLHFTLTAPR